MKKHRADVLVEKNSFVDEGDGVISFPNGLPITDNSEQRNGTRYDIQSMDLSEYKGQITADHVDMLQSVIGKVQGIAKVGNQVIVNAIQFAVNDNALARLAYNLFTGGFCTDFSVETYGPQPDENGVYYDAKLIGLSAVVVGNNKNATVNQVVLNSIEKSKEMGLDVEEVEKNFLTEFHVTSKHTEEPVKNSNNSKKEEDTNEMKFVTIKNSRDFPVVLKYKNAAEDEVETTVPAGGTLDVSDDQQEDVEKQVKEAEAPKAPAAKEDEKTDEEKAAEKQANALSAAIEAAMKPFGDKLATLEKNAFNSRASEPGFKKDENARDLRNSEKENIKSMDWQDRHAKQINAAWDLMKRHDQNGAVELNKINEVNLEMLKKEGIVKNSLSISDFGNFVISPELITEIAGCRNDYTALINATNWKETLSVQFAWLRRQGDIGMQEVEFCDDGQNGNLKPISEYDATIETANLMELAAVTPVCNAATRFLAADLLGDVATGYRNDYDRKRAQLVVARLAQAVEDNGNSVPFDTNPAVSGIVALLEAYKQIANCTPNGTFVMNSRSHATILEYALRAGVNGPLAQIFVTGDVPTMFGRPYIIVSDDLMPSLDTASSVHLTVEGQSVNVPFAVFYGDLTKFTGRTSGGLQYDLSTEAAYEQGGVVKSAYQRNELVLRGSFFRGGAITDPNQVAGILAPGIS